MREIKFDAIYKPTGEHFSPYKIDFNGKTVVGDFGGEINDWCHFSLDGKYGDVILRQYTGLKDKNGKEIYEGDIVANLRNSKNEVCWDQEEFGWVAKGKWPNGKDSTIMLADLNAVATIEVVGNIFENPSLLEESK